MSKQHAERYIRVQKQNTRSVDEQVQISHAMWESGIGPDADGIKKDDLGDELQVELDFNIETSIRHLTEIDALEGNAPSGPDFYAISESRDEIVLGRIDEVAVDDIGAIIEHVQDNDPAREGDEVAVTDGGEPTLRGILADEFDIIPTAVEQYLQGGDHVEKLNAAVEAIEDSDTVAARDDYGKIIFRRGAYRYRLTEEQANRYEQEREVWE